MKKDERVERAVRVVPAAPQEIFDLLADPRRHSDIDGSGSVKGAAVDAPDRLSLGAKFGMKMRMGIPYSITSEVVEFDEPNLIAWRHMGGHIWRFRLSETDGGTEVTEEFDWGPSHFPPLLQITGTPGRNTKSIEATLDRLVDRFA